MSQNPATTDKASEGKEGETIFPISDESGDTGERAGRLGEWVSDWWATEVMQSWYRSEQSRQREKEELCWNEREREQNG